MDWHNLMDPISQTFITVVNEKNKESNKEPKKKDRFPGKTRSVKDIQTGGVKVFFICNRPRESTISRIAGIRKKK